MSVTVIKAEQVVNAAFGLLEREVVLPNLVWRNAVGDFAGAQGDTVSLRLPSYLGTARTRALRSGASRTKDTLKETKVDVTLTTDLYVDVAIDDETMSLDIVDFGAQVLNPVMNAIVRGYEDALVTTMEGATYQWSLGFDPSDPFGSLVDAGVQLDKANVPQQGRSFVCGSNIAAAIVKSDQFSTYNSVGSPATVALQEATVSRAAGFTVVTCPALDPDHAYAFHRSAYILSARAPKVPPSVTWGATSAVNGFAIRAVRVFDPDAVADTLLTDAWLGTSVVEDAVTVDAKGRVTPINSPADNGSDKIFVRAVKLTNLAS